MITPGRLDLTVQRWTPFVYPIDFEGLDFTGATMAMQVRLYRDAPGDPLIDLANAASNAEGLSVSVATVEGVTVSTVQIRINKTTIQDLLLNAGKPGDDARLVYDLHITGGGIIETRWFEGDLIIHAGVTR
ncbi:hypothetical protein [Brevundimonas sp. Bb-A]|uniref:hypothetical protein n=1 Tax=Brevundimonas sp. Bb-A TaxID=2560058 RepID=UPI00128ECD0D|nr:hypothetical protein [Brevundimonas sp. Bb-A]QFU31499.1 hypothetical protein BSP_07485 [Brevundimonas sp. Bb-A]